MARITIKDLLSRDASGYINGVFRISEPGIMQTKNGKDFLRCKISDKTGSMPAVCWDLTDGIKGLAKDGAVLEVSAEISAYQGAHQAKIGALAPPLTFDPTEFERRTAYNIDEMWGKLVDFVSSFKSSYVRTVAEELLINAGYSEAFKKSPAATGMHHAFVGGLLEHTWQMVETGDTLLKLPYYSQVLNRDLCLFGLLFHDFGKIFEYKQDGSFKRTVQGRLVPHIPMVAAMIFEACNKFGHPEVIRDHMMHVVLAHHGRVEWGSPVTMNIPEAAFVHYIDHLHGDVFGWIQKLESDGAGQEILRMKYGGNELVVERFSDILKKCEASVSAEVNEEELPF